MSEYRYYWIYIGTTSTRPVGTATVGTESTVPLFSQKKKKTEKEKKKERKEKKKERKNEGIGTIAPEPKVYGHANNIKVAYKFEWPIRPILPMIVNIQEKNGINLALYRLL